MKFILRKGNDLIQVPNKGYRELFMRHGYEPFLVLSEGSYCGMDSATKSPPTRIGDFIQVTLGSIKFEMNRERYVGRDGMGYFNLSQNIRREICSSCLSLFSLDTVVRVLKEEQKNTVKRLFYASRNSVILRKAFSKMSDAELVAFHKKHSGNWDTDNWMALEFPVRLLPIMLTVDSPMIKESIEKRLKGVPLEREKTNA